jgi:hypothetical protein
MGAVVSLTRPRPAGETQFWSDASGAFRLTCLLAGTYTYAYSSLVFLFRQGTNACRCSSQVFPDRAAEIPPVLKRCSDRLNQR